MAVSRKAMTEGIRTSTFRGTLNKARFYNSSVSRLRETREPAPFTQGSRGCSRTSAFFVSALKTERYRAVPKGITMTDRPCTHWLSAQADFMESLQNRSISFDKCDETRYNGSVWVEKPNIVIHHSEKEKDGSEMYKIVRKKELNANVTLMDIEAPFVARKAKAGQFIIFRIDEMGERVPLTIAGYDREKGTVSIIFQKVGFTTKALGELNEGDYIRDFVGPLGKPTETEGKKKVCVVGGGVGCAIAYPVLKKFHDDGAEVHAVVGFKNKDLVILEDDFKKSSDKLVVCTDDGSYGKKGLVTEALKELIDAGNQYDEIFAIGPMIMMKFVCKTTEPYGIPTTVSMSPIMIDGTGMCGGCRLSVGGEMKFACVDGPDFDGHKVDWDLAVKRNQMYKDFEAHKYEETCNLFKKEAE